MVERMKDNEDIRLESLFAFETIADNGFSAGVMKRVRRQMWIRRLALPVAFVVGGAIAIKPLAGLVTALFSLASAIPASIDVESTLAPASVLPSGSTIVLGIMAVFAVAMIGRMLEE